MVCRADQKHASERFNYGLVASIKNGLAQLVFRHLWFLHARSPHFGYEGNDRQSRPCTGNWGSARRPSHSLRQAPHSRSRSTATEKTTRSWLFSPDTILLPDNRNSDESNFDQIAGDNVAPRDLRSKRWSVAPWCANGPWRG